MIVVFITKTIITGLADYTCLYTGIRIFLKIWALYHIGRGYQQRQDNAFIIVTRLLQLITQVNHEQFFNVIY